MTKSLVTPKLGHLALKDGVVRRLHQAETALQKATDLLQLKLVADVASAQQVFATRQRLGEDVIGYAHAIKIHALSRLGELLREMDKARGAAGGGKKTGPRGTYVVPRDRTATLADLGISKKVSSVAQQLADLPAETREAIARREETLSRAQRKQKVVTARRQADLPSAKFRVILADPPWEYADKADAGSVQTGGAAHHYPPMSIAALCALPVANICEPNAVLFLWVTSPIVLNNPGPREVIEAWGFAYKASFIWDKEQHNRGHYNSVRHEFLLVCVKGTCHPDNLVLIDSVQTIPKTRHSEKPEQFRSIIDTLYPHGKRVELFARRPVEGWVGWGNELLLSRQASR